MDDCSEMERLAISRCCASASMSLTEHEPPCRPEVEKVEGEIQSPSQWHRETQTQRDVAVLHDNHLPVAVADGSARTMLSLRYEESI